MSLCLFPGIDAANIPAVNASDGSAFTGAYAEYEVKIGVLVGGSAGRVRVGKVRFGVQEADQGMCDNAAAEIAEQIAAASSGVIMGLVKHLGKYRNDEMPGAIEAGQAIYGVVYVTNGKTSVSDMTPEPQKLLKQQLFVPFTSLTNFAALVDKLKTKNITLAGSRFTDDSKTSLSIGKVENVNGTKTLDVNSVKAFGLVDIDNAAGASDGVISEKDFS